MGPRPMGAVPVSDSPLPPEERLYIRIHRQYIGPGGFAGGFRPVKGGISADRASMCRPCETRARIPKDRKSRPEDYGVVTLTVAYIESIRDLKAVSAPLKDNPAHVNIRDNLDDDRYLSMVRSRLEEGVISWEFRPGDPQPRV